MPQIISLWLTRKKLVNYFLLIILFLLLVSLFSPILKVPLVSDDYIWLVDIAPFDNFDVFFWRTFAFKEADFRYRPLMPTTIRLCYQISGAEPFCMHLVSFTLHFLNTVLVGMLSYKLTKNRLSAWAAIFFFAIYFAHVENIAWVSDLGNLLATFFMLVTVMLFLQFTGQGHYYLYVLSLMTFALAMISKESALSLGPILVAWGAVTFWKASSSHKRRLIMIGSSSYALLVGLYLFFVNRSGLSLAFSEAGNYTYRFDLITLGNALYYPLNFIWPTDFTMLEKVYQGLFDMIRTHTIIQDSLIKTLAVPGIFWVVGGTVAIWGGILWLIWQRHVMYWLSLVWIILGILPVIFIGGHSERHIYVASVGVSLLVGQLFERGIITYKQQTMYLLPIVTAILFMVILALHAHWTQVRVQNWQVAGNTARQIISTVMTIYPDLSSESELWFIDLPDNFNGAYIFRLGIQAALQMEIRDTRLIAHHLFNMDELPQTLDVNQYIFIFQDGRLVDLTPNYRFK